MGERSALRERTGTPMEKPAASTEQTSCTSTSTSRLSSSSEGSGSPSNMGISTPLATSAPETRPHLMDGLPLQHKLQWYIPPRRPYTRRELLADRIVNFTGAVLSWIGTPVLGIVSLMAGDSVEKQLGFWLHGLGLILMLTCSALYHYWAWQWAKSDVLLSLDHVGISGMIMGCYIPMMIYVDCIGVLIFVCVLGVFGWLLELGKIVFEKHTLSGGSGAWNTLDILHVVRYLVMGWACAPVIPRMIHTLPSGALWLSVVGGLLYTSGVFIFIQGNMEYHMAIWHFMVLVASMCFYMSNLIFLVGPAPS